MKANTANDPNLIMVHVVNTSSMLWMVDKIAPAWMQTVGKTERDNQVSNSM